MGTIDVPKMSIDMRECFTSNEICLLETSTGIILCTIFLVDNSLHAPLNNGARPKYNEKK